MERHIVEVLEKQVKEAQAFLNIQTRIQQHLDATRRHEARMEERLSACGQKPSGLKSALSNLMGNLMGSIGGMLPDALAMTARNDYAVEHFEIAAYGLLIAVAQTFGDQQTVQACMDNLRDEIEMANWLETHIVQAGILALQQSGIRLPEADVAAETTVALALQAAHRSLPPPAATSARAAPAASISTVNAGWCVCVIVP